MKFETIAIRTQTERTQHQEHSTPIFATSGYIFDDADSMRELFADETPGNVYSRYTNPNVNEFETKIALLEGTESAKATSTGMMAIFATFASFLKSGDHIIMSQAVFGSTIKLMENFFSKWNIKCSFVNSNEISEWKKEITEKTKIIYLETPSNPGLEIQDIEAMSALTKDNDILLVVDNCFATPYIQKPILLGADIVIHSATKYIDGQGRVMGGVIAGSTKLMKIIEPFMRNAGPTLSPFNAWILSKSLETLAIRMDRHCSNALSLAKWLTNEVNVKSVNYPGLPSFSGYKIAQKQMTAGGGMVTFELNGGLEEGKLFLNKIKTLSLSANLGDTRTIITHPASTTHSKLTAEQRKMVGITPSLIRVSVGLEHIDDIIADIKQALVQQKLNNR